MINNHQIITTKQSLCCLEIRDGQNYVKAVKRDRGICQACKSLNNIIVHHKDKDITNNNLDNLICLCRSCHALEHSAKLVWSKPRLKEILELRQQRKTYQQIGDYFNISRQRIHQIIAKSRSKS